MKYLQFAKSSLGLASVLTLAICLGTSAVAGPGPQYWQQMEKNRADNAAKKSTAAAPAKPATEATPMACPHCKTTAIEENSFYNVSGKIMPHSTVIGTKHSCQGCSGVISEVHGQLTDEMQRNCPLCAKAAPGCCSVKT